MATEFTPFTAIIGGLLIGLASAALLHFNGRIAGITGIFDGLLWAESPGERAWRLAFVAGLLAASLPFVLEPSMTPLPVDRSTGVIIAAGLIVGFGTRLSNGCTSGHGVCGIARLSPRSIVATLTFIATGAATVAIMGGA